MQIFKKLREEVTNHVPAASEGPVFGTVPEVIAGSLKPCRPEIQAAQETRDLGPLCPVFRPGPIGGVRN